MELLDYQKVMIHFKDKNEDYKKRLLAAYYDGVMIGDLDNYTDEQYLNALNKVIEDWPIPEEIKRKFTHKGKEYNILDIEEITIDHWIQTENLISSSEEIIEIYPGILAIYTDTKDTEAFKELDHKIAMPIIDFFLELYTTLEVNIRPYMEMVKNETIIQELPATVELWKSLINDILLYYSFYYLQQIKSPLRFLP